MPISSYRKTFGEKEDYFNGYFSREKITDLDEDLIATTITEDDLTKVSRQLDVSMGEMFQLINIFAVVLFALLIYLLTKLIIEKNANAISMVKILGYENREINSLYLTSTTWVVILSILLQPAAVYLDDIWNLRISDVILLRLADLISETSGLSGDVCDGNGSVCAGSLVAI